MGDRRERCATCVFYSPDEMPVGFDPIGVCRAHTPQLTGWPRTTPVDWCGEHQPDVKRRMEGSRNG